MKALFLPQPNPIVQRGRWKHNLLIALLLHCLKRRMKTFENAQWRQPQPNLVQRGRWKQSCPQLLAFENAQSRNVELSPLSEQETFENAQWRQAGFISLSKKEDRNKLPLNCPSSPQSNLPARLLALS